MRKSPKPRLLSLVALGLVVAGCGGDGSARPAATAAPSTVRGSITVSAAASLTEAFAAIGDGFERAHPEATVTYNFGSSSTLATQIERGAPADTFASADEASMDELVRADLVDGTPVVFARNALVIVTKPGNPERIEALADLAAVDVVSLCGATAPCGRYATEILDRAAVMIPETRITRGQDVKATLRAVTTGDADAAIVYVTDARRAGDEVTTVAIPDAANAVATYPVATLAASANPATADAFVDELVSPRGRATLRSFGFLAP